MPDLVYGYFPRPLYVREYLLSTVGYLKSIAVEQEGDYDQIRFALEIHNVLFNGSIEPLDFTFIIMFDRNASAGFAQLQLLRQALMLGNKDWNMLVYVHFNFTDRTHSAAYCYYVDISWVDTYPVTPQGYFGYVTTSIFADQWWLHEE